MPAPGPNKKTDPFRGRFVRIVEISGKPETTVTFSAGGVPARVDRNGAYLVEAMYVQYFLPEARKGKYPLLMWHGGGLSGVTYETTPDGREPAL